MSPGIASIDRDIAEEDVVLLSLTDANKAALFETVTRDFHRRKAEAESIHEQLTKLNPVVAGDFGYKNTAVSEAPFRLVFPRKSITDTGPLREATSYVVVSYCWHDNSWNSVVKDIQPPWPFSSGMAQSILDLLESDTEGVWLDQLCVDQSNEDEKQLSIGAMDVIYRSSRRLVILLEDVQLTDEEEAVAIKYREKIMDRQLEWDISDEERRIIFIVCVKILSARWFTRAWCSHELRVREYWADGGWKNQHAFRVYNSRGGVVRLPVIFITYIRQYASGPLHEVVFTQHGSLEAQQKDYMRFMILFSKSRVQSLGESSAKPSLLAEMHHVTGFKCSVPTDRISIAINLCGIGLFYKGSVRTVDEAYFVFTLLALAAGEVAVLTLVGPQLETCTAGGTYTSWARRTVDATMDLRLPIVSDCRDISAAQPERIDLDLLIIDQQPKSPSEDSMRRAAAILEAGYSRNQYAVESTLESTKHMVARFERIYDNPTWARVGADHVQRLIACCLDCGLDWMLSVWNIFETEIIKKDSTFGRDFAVDPGIIPTGNALLAWYNVSAENTHDYETAYLEPILQFLTFITDICFRGLLPQPSIIQTSSSGHYAFINKRYLMERYVLAVPAALADQFYTLNRVWILEKVDQMGRWPYRTNIYPLNWAEGSTAQFMRATFTNTWQDDEEPAWRIVDKTYLLGCPTLVPDGEVVTRKQNQRVYGRAFFYQEGSWGDPALD